MTVTLIPRQPVPHLALPLVGGGRFDLASTAAESFQLLVFYRGRHCPVCKTQLTSLNAHVDALSGRGVVLTVISCDTQERAEATVADWAVPELRLAYDLSITQARAWGLFITASRGTTSLGIEEPQRFAEPGLFLIKPDLTLFFSAVQTMPFARPRIEDVISAIDFIKKNDYPPRGDVV